MRSTLVSALIQEQRVEPRRRLNGSVSKTMDEGVQATWIEILTRAHSV